MKEKQIEKIVCNYAKSKYDAIPVKFTSPARRSVPDRLFIFKGGVIVFIEFKAPGGKLTTGQAREIARLSERDHNVHVVDCPEAGKALVDRYGSFSETKAQC